MLISQGDPFQALFDLQREMESSLRSEWLPRSTAGRGAFPPINIFRKGEDYIAIVELAGIDKSELEIEAKDDLIRLSGRKAASYPDDASAHRLERVFGTFDRTISVPIKFDAGGIKAEYRNGILALFIPRAEQDKPRKVKIG